MTVALITDQHLDGRKGNIIFWEYFAKFYDEVFRKFHCNETQTTLP